MRKYLVVYSLFSCIFLFSGCYWVRVKMPSRVWHLETLNPTTYVFHVPIDSIVRITEHRLKHKKGEENCHLWSLTQVEHKILGHDYCLRMERDWVASPVYRRKKSEGCLYQVHLYLCCDSLAPGRTRVATAVYRSLVQSGFSKEYRWRHDAPPTSIEEYQLLRLIGTLVGEKDMPAVRYPKELKQEEIDVLENQR